MSMDRDSKYTDDPYYITPEEEAELEHEEPAGPVTEDDVMEPVMNALDRRREEKLAADEHYASVKSEVAAERALHPEDFYPRPAHGWTCFHCGETFTTPGGAQDHFGETPASVPGCLIKLGNERGLLMALRKVEAERDQAIAQRNSADEAEEAAHGFIVDVRSRFKGAHSVYDAWCMYDSMEGRALAAEAIVREAEKLDPSVVQRARAIVCGPEPKDGLPYDKDELGERGEKGGCSAGCPCGMVVVESGNG